MKKVHKKIKKKLVIIGFYLSTLTDLQTNMQLSGLEDSKTGLSLKSNLHELGFGLGLGCQGLGLGLRCSGLETQDRSLLRLGRGVQKILPAGC